MMDWKAGQGVRYERKKNRNDVGMGDRMILGSQKLRMMTENAQEQQGISERSTGKDTWDPNGNRGGG